MHITSIILQSTGYLSSHEFVRERSSDRWDIISPQHQFQDFPNHIEPGVWSLYSNLPYIPFPVSMMAIPTAGELSRLISSGIPTGYWNTGGEGRWFPGTLFQGQCLVHHVSFPSMWKLSTCQMWATGQSEDHRKQSPSWPMVVNRPG